VAQTGSIGESFVQLEPCAVNDDCLVLLPKTPERVGVAKLVIAAAILHAEKWRFNYGRKLTPNRIARFRLPDSAPLEEWVEAKLVDMTKVIAASLAPYSDADETPCWYIPAPRATGDQP
jgi:type I restriction enzyme M protein